MLTEGNHDGISGVETLDARPRHFVRVGTNLPSSKDKIGGRLMQHKPERKRDRLVKFRSKAEMPRGIRLISSTHRQIAAKWGST